MGGLCVEGPGEETPEEGQGCVGVKAEQQSERGTLWSLPSRWPTFAEPPSLLSPGWQACAGTSLQPQPPAQSPSHSSWPVWPRPSLWAPRSLASWSPAPVAERTDGGARISSLQGSHVLSPFAAWPGCMGRAQSRRRLPRTERGPRRRSSTPPSCLPPRAYPRRSWLACLPRSFSPGSATCPALTLGESLSFLHCLHVPYL